MKVNPTQTGDQNASTGPATFTPGNFVSAKEEQAITDKERTEQKYQDINNVLKEYAISADDWRHHDLALLLHEWANRFNTEFDLGISTPAIKIDQVRVRKMGYYLPGRNGFGLYHEITINTKHLKRPLTDTLDTLLHELLHEWQEVHGKPGKGNYHNDQFRAKARSYGLLVSPRGMSMGVEPGPFTELLAQHGVDTSVLQLPQDEPAIIRARGVSKLKKWSCGCTNVRAAVELKAQCLKCGELFQKADPAW